MSQLRIPAVYMRGGTSKGVFFLAEDLPSDPQARDRILMRVIGSPDRYGKHTDGMGGATSSTSKVVILSKSGRPDCDVDYLFGQVAIDQPLVDWSGNCGNLSAAVGPFAISMGLVTAPPDGTATVRIWQANIRKKIVSHVPMTGGEVQELGDFQLDGVAFPAAEVELEFLDPADGEGEAGPRTGGGATFPTGNHIDVLDVPGVGKIEATLINAGNPTIFVDAAGLGLKGTELQGDINGDKALLARVEFGARAGCGRDGRRGHAGGGDGPAAAHAQARLRGLAGRLHRVRRPPGRGRLDRPFGAHLLDGRAPPRDDGHWRGGDRGRGGHSGHRRASRRAGRRRRPRALRPSFRHVEGRRRSAEGRQSLEGPESPNEPLGAPPDGRLGPRPRRLTSICPGRSRC